MFSHIPPGHFDGSGITPPAPCLNRGRFESSCPQGDRLAARHEELEDLRVVEALHLLSINVRHQVTGPKTGVEGGRTFVHLHDQMMNRVEVCVAEVNTDGANCKAETPWSPTNNNRRLQAVD
jgi:hypothetical protein